MSAPAVPPLSALRRAGVLVLFAAGGAGMQALLSTAGDEGNHSRRTAALAAEGGAVVSSARGKKSSAPPPTMESLAGLSAEQRFASLTAALPFMEIADLMPLVEALARAERSGSLPGMVDPFAQPRPDLREPMLRLLLARWAELDPAGLAVFTSAGEFRSDYRLRSLALLVLAEQQGPAALAAAQKKTPALVTLAAVELLARDPSRLEELRQFLKFDCLAERDRTSLIMNLASLLKPDQAIQFATMTGITGLLWTAVSTLVEQSGLQAVDKVLAMPRGPARDVGLHILLDRMADPREGISDSLPVGPFQKLYDELSTDRARADAMSNYIRLLYRQNPDAALKFALETPPGKGRTEALELAFACLPADTAPAQRAQIKAESWLAGNRDDEPVYGWSDPGGNYAAVFPGKRFGARTMKSEFSAWLTADKAQAMSWFETVKDPGLKAELAGVLILQDGQPLTLLPDSESRLQMAARLLGSQDGAVRLNSVPPEWRQAAKIDVLVKQRVPKEAWAAADSETRRIAAEDAVRSRIEDMDLLSREGVEDWLPFFNSIPPSERSLGAYYEAGAAYIKQDEAAASQWLNSLPPGAERDAAATALVEHLVKPGDSQDGEAAFAWAAAMSGETERTRYTAEAARAWAANDPAAASAAVEASALSPAEKTALLRQFPQQGGAR